MLNFKTRKNKYKPLSKTKTESELNRERFIKSSVSSNEKKPNARKRSILVHWISSLGVYLSREGPAIGPLPHSLDDLRNEQTLNYRLSQVILAYDLQAVEIQNRLLVKHAAKKQEEAEYKKLTPENENVFVFDTPPELENYPGVDKFDSDESFDVQFQNEEQKRKVPKMVLNMDKRLPKSDIKLPVVRPQEGSSKDLFTDRDLASHRIYTGKAGNSKNTQNAITFTGEVVPSGLPLSQLPNTPVPTPTKHRIVPSPIALRREGEVQLKQSPLSKELRRNLKNDDINQGYFESSQLVKNANDNRQLKRNSFVDIRPTSKILEGSNNEDLNTPESATSTSTLTKEFTTPTLDPIFLQNHLFRMERQSMRPVESIGLNNSFNEFGSNISTRRSSMNLPSRSPSVPMAEQNLHVFNQDQQSVSDDEENVVFFDLEDSRPNSGNGGNLLRRSSSSISGSIKALRHVGKVDRKRESHR